MSLIVLLLKGGAKEEERVFQGNRTRNSIPMEAQNHLRFWEISLQTLQWVVHRWKRKSLSLEAMDKHCWDIKPQQA